MLKTIIDKLPDIEHTQQIKLLYVAESGSRAWGFSSADSDYDVRGIFIYPPHRYLSIESPPESFSWIEDHWFDISAWEITKTLRLLKKSNNTLLEWLQSPLVYRHYGSVQAELLALAQLYFQPKTALANYRGIAKIAAQHSTAEGILLKKWFYQLRSLLAAYWVVSNRTIAPMQLSELLCTLDPEEQRAIADLVLFKADKDEQFIWNPPLPMQQLIDRLWQETDCALPVGKTPDSTPLNQWFRKMLDETDH